MVESQALARRLAELVQGDRAARASALSWRYWNHHYTGSFFHVFADDEHPDEITERDLIAVSMLNVTVPASVTVWLLSDLGRSAVTALLREVPTDLDIWEAGQLISSKSELWTLYKVLASANWPTPKTGNHMGRTKISKLLAAKRPRLVPIYDSVVAKVLPATPNYWAAFATALRDDHLRSLLAEVSGRGAPRDAGLLRRIDAMLWMIGLQPTWS